MNCPNCTTLMEEVDIAGIKVDYCKNGCHGVFFDNFEMQKMDEKHENADNPVLQAILEQTREDDSRAHQLTCPRCDIKMRKHGYSHGTGIYIDKCYSCNGVWLDKGELAAIRDNFRSEAVRKQVINQMVNDDPQISNQLSQMEAERAVLNQKYASRRSSAGRSRGFFGFITDIF